ncbi:IclR family transcriptional regulator C-terminal domain-containing protein [Streptomyces sp. RerS4]|uniref:IclR family transcriptional regulator C-terminal domain-containing protein n=1 Tax=Streptomyces sp. RerS4 TaxID=2942449 RepID=UPI00201C403A|nr:IclR family transcriptional regulator C-terminal domain-containing protein [Streptomyces sp. RerS4]UQW99160.1 IclR family transcriptional regulator C-terminal domain-containing protein [Streptomyces sp. RerS4]
MTTSTTWAEQSLVSATRSWHGPDTAPVLEYVSFRETAHANALGKASLAQLTEDQRKDHLNRHWLIELTANTITDPLKLERSLTTAGQRPVYYDRQEYSDNDNCAAVALSLPGRNGCVGISLPPTSHPRIGEASRLLNDRSTKALLSLVLTLTAEKGAQADDSPVQPMYLTHAVSPPELRTTAGDLLAA